MDVGEVPRVFQPLNKRFVEGHSPKDLIYWKRKPSLQGRLVERRGLGTKGNIFLLLSCDMFNSWARATNSWIWTAWYRVLLDFPPDWCMRSTPDLTRNATQPNTGRSLNACQKCEGLRWSKDQRRPAWWGRGAGSRVGRENSTSTIRGHAGFSPGIFSRHNLRTQADWPAKSIVDHQLTWTSPEVSPEHSCVIIRWWRKISKTMAGRQNFSTVLCSCTRGKHRVLLRTSTEPAGW